MPDVPEGTEEKMNMEARIEEIKNLKAYVKQLMRENGIMEEDRRRLNIWTLDHCTCGKDGGAGDCLACDVYHVARLDRDEESGEIPT